MSYIFKLPIILTAAETKTAVFDSGFLITVAVIVFSTLLIAFIHHLKKDKCIKSFKADIVTVYFNDGKKLKGRMDVENTGCELIARNPGEGIKHSFIIYKDEYPNIRFFVRYHSDLDEKRLKQRTRLVKKTYHPNFLRRFRRKINIFFKIIRDSMMDIFTAFSGRIKTANASYATSEKYIANVNKEAVTSMDATYNPLLEKYIGNYVICSHVFNDKVCEINGILKDYTGEYIELLDVELDTEELKLSGADLVIPRRTSRVRNLGEDAVKLLTLPDTFNLSWYKKSVKKSSYESNKKANK
jgi:hypothetical protein